MKKLVNYFLQGLLYVAPLGITIYMIFLTFSFVDGVLGPLIEAAINFSIPGLGLLLMLVLITILGFVGQSVFAQPVKLVIERLMKRAPILHVVYSSIRDFMEAFVGKEKKFTQPVKVIVNFHPEIIRFGFITQRDLTEFQIPDKVAVYFPYSYGFNGEVHMVSPETVQLIDVPSTEVMKFILSGGVTRV